MFERRMLGIRDRGGAVVEIGLPLGWPVREIAHRRDADTGPGVVTYVTVLSAKEAARINEEFKRQAGETLRANRAAHGEDYSGDHLDENDVAGGAAVDRLLEAIRQEGYFSSWVVIEECTID